MEKRIKRAVKERDVTRDLKVVPDGNWTQVWDGDEPVATFYNREDALAFVDLGRLRQRPAVTIRLYSISQRRPVNGEKVVYVRRAHSFDSVSFQPEEADAEYSWFEIDEQGRLTGSQAGYREGDQPDASYRLEIMFNGMIADDDFWWCPVSEYDDAFPSE